MFITGNRRTNFLVLQKAWFLLKSGGYSPEIISDLKKRVLQEYFEAQKEDFLIIWRLEKIYSILKKIFISI